MPKKPINQVMVQAVEGAMASLRSKHGQAGLTVARRWLLHQSRQKRVEAEIAEREKQLEELKRTGTLPQRRTVRLWK